MLTLPQTPFVGRDAELERLRIWLRDPDCRLATIIGPGGVGKTRLALEAVASLRDAAGRPQAGEGVVVVPLAGVDARAPLDDTLASAIVHASAISIAGVERPAGQLQRALHNRKLLILLDNFEHFAGVARYLAELLQTAPELRLLVTSRERLGLRVERYLVLDGLPFSGEDAAGPAVELFARLASDSAADMRSLAAEKVAIAHICQLVGGLPLGIELAASWANVLTPTEIAAEIERNLGFLVANLHDLPERHQSLQAAFATSWERLNDQMRTALARLSVCRGSFDRAAAAALDAGLPVLGTLVNMSLVRRVASDSRGARYDLLEPIRHFVAEQPESAPIREAAADRHAEHFLGLLASHTAALRGAGQSEAMSALRQELGQIRAAWDHALERGHFGLIAQATPALFHLYDIYSWFREGEAAFATAARRLAGLDEARTTAAAIVARQGWFTFLIGRQPEARAMLEQSAAVLAAGGAEAELVFVLNYLSAICAYLGDDATALRAGEEGLALARRLGDVYGEAVACNVLGQAAYARGEFAAAQRYSERSMGLERQIGNRWSMSFSLVNLGKAALAQGRPAEAGRLIAEALTIREELGDVRGAAICRHRLGEIALAGGDPGAAEGHFQQSIALSRGVGDAWGQVVVLMSLSQLYEHSRSAAAGLAPLQEALPLALDAGAPPLVAKVLAAAAPLVRAGQPALAAELMSLAAALPADLELLRPLAARLVAVIPPAVRPQTPAYPAGLTSREVDVLRLLAEGLTDAQIAERLIISRRTVTTHLTSIYGKLGVNTRSAACRFAVERGLV